MSKEDGEENDPGRSAREDRRDGMLCLDHEYWQLKERVVHMEQRILRALAFDLEVCHPFRFLVHFAHFIECSSETLRKAWSIAVESLWSSQCCLDTEPNALAAASLYIALTLPGLPTRKASSTSEETSGQRQATPKPESTIREESRPLPPPPLISAKTVTLPESKLRTLEVGSCLTGFADDKATSAVCADRVARVPRNLQKTPWWQCLGVTNLVLEGACISLLKAMDVPVDCRAPPVQGTLQRAIAGRR